MSEDIQTRLKNATDRCLKGREAWEKDKKDASLREELVESLHELRRATARLEIDIAINDRDLKGANTIPIPSHKSQPRRGRSSGGAGKKSQGNKPKVESKSDNSKPVKSSDNKAEQSEKKPVKKSIGGNETLTVDVKKKPTA